MTFTHAGVTAVLVLGLSGAVGVGYGFARQAPAASPESQSRPVSQPASDADAVPPSLDVERLPINLGRIQRQLYRASIREEHEGLNLRFFVDVFAPAPPIRLFTPQDNLVWGPAPYGAPTHRDMLNLVTPREFRSPPMDFSALVRWLRERSRDQ
jgi:hypothetical protein